MCRHDYRTGKNYKPEFGIFVAIGCSVLILYFLVDSLKYAFSYMSQLYDKLDYGKTYFPIIIKVLAIAYITEFTSQLCKDAGESSIASKVGAGGENHHILRRNTSIYINFELSRAAL